jgi:plastocyanin
MLRTVGLAACITLLGLSVALPVGANAEAGANYTITIKDHRFTPAEIKVPAGQKITLLVKNLDATPEEFESHDLHREKIIPGGAEATITLRPLEKGTYSFFGEFNQATAQGKLIAE